MASFLVVNDPADWVPLGNDPLHQTYTGQVRWTTVNAAEAMPGVLSPFTWSLCGWTFDLAIRRGFHRLGAMTKEESLTPADTGKRICALFYGRLAVNIDAFCGMGDRLPGSSAAAVETQFFGSSGAPDDQPPAAPYPDRPWQTPVIAAKFGPNAWRAVHRVRSAPPQATQWWLRHISRVGPIDPAAAESIVLDAGAMIAEAATWHTIVTMLAQGANQQLAALCEAAGHPGLESKLLAGGENPETATVGDLWAVSRQELTLVEFVKRHGYHGPKEGETSCQVWREDVRPLMKLIDTYQRMPDRDDPRLRLARRLEQRADAERLLRSSLGPAKARMAGLLLRVGRTVTPLRETGRDTMLKGIDVGRFAVRGVGRYWAGSGILDDPDDAFYLTVAELRKLPADARKLVAERRSRGAEYENLELPQHWRGSASAVAVRPVDEAQPVSGAGVSPGTVEGTARVLLGPDDDDLEPGEILVCPTTDPGWASYFLVAAGVVIDVGGPLSHGAIVAREMGIPCVINTRDGTRRIRTGQRLRVDGSAGTVTFLDH